MKISFKQFQEMSSRELHDIYFEASREIETRNHDLGGHRFVHDKDVTNAENEPRGTEQWYVLNREKFGRAENG